MYVMYKKKTMVNPIAKYRARFFLKYVISLIILYLILLKVYSQKNFIYSCLVRAGNSKRNPLTSSSSNYW